MMDVAAVGWQYWIVIGLQVICIVHVLRSRQEFWWIWMIVFLPFIGSAVYLLIHRHSMLPSARMPFNIPIPMMEALNERRIERDFKTSDTLDNRIQFANVLINRGAYADAITLLEPSMSGPLRGHLGLLFTCARAHFANRDIPAATAILERAEAVPNNDRLKQRNLLLAMCYESTGDQTRAEAKYQAAQGGFVGEEAKARYALFLTSIGRKSEAQDLFRRILDDINSAPWAYRREQKAWRDMAKAQLAAAKAASS
ncbi:MAG TPA: hypothetical protein VHX44_02795 [Planctomycetota bacterium]|jgi:hypothetical protein|nr:hypothetical protein [Planctomycetota bacterium]